MSGNGNAVGLNLEDTRVCHRLQHSIETMYMRKTYTVATMVLYDLYT